MIFILRHNAYHVAKVVAFSWLNMESWALSVLDKIIISKELFCNSSIIYKRFNFIVDYVPHEIEIESDNI